MQTIDGGNENDEGVYRVYGEIISNFMVNVQTWIFGKALSMKTGSVCA